MKPIENAVVKSVENTVIIHAHITFYLIVPFSNINCHPVNKISTDKKHRRATVRKCDNIRGIRNHSLCTGIMR